MVLSVDARRAPGPPSGFEVTTHGGRVGTGIDAVDWARRGTELGAGEILLNSMDADGTTIGFDLELIRAVRAVVTVPVIASGGAGALAHFAAGRGRGRGRGAGGQRVPLRHAAHRAGQDRPARRRPPRQVRGNSPAGKVIFSGATSGVPTSSWIWACAVSGMSRGLPVKTWPL